MPQLRQMVLENTERINRNDLIINKIRMEATEQSRKISEQEEWSKNFRRELEESMRISRERMDRIEKSAEKASIEHEKMSHELKESIKETSVQIKETDQQIKETDQQIKETDQQIKETDQQIKETGQQFKEMFAETRQDVKEMFAETNAYIRRISVELLGTTGHIVEGLVSSSTEKIFKDAGFNLHNSGKNLKKELASENKQMELDVMLSNDKIVVPVEVKANFTKQKVKRFLHKMEMFRKFFPEYADKEVLAAIAAINYDTDADTLAHNEGLLVIRVSSDDIFTLDPVDKQSLRRF